MGSNLLVSDAGYRGLVLKTSQFNQTLFENETTIQLGAGVPISKILRLAGQNNWSGFEILGGIPGSIGGACFMNAGTHLGETKSLLTALEGYLLKPQFKKINFHQSDLHYSYRTHHFLPDHFVITSTWWKKVKGENVKSKILEVIERRKSTQPVDQPSCGSVFKNPYESGLRSWQVIEKLGLRGYRVGGAQFSEKHANFIVNLGNAKSQDIYDLIHLAKKRAQEELGIILKEEVRYLGF